MSPYRYSVIRLADIQEFCCSPACENPHIPSLPVPLCAECYDKIHQHAVTEVFERIRPLWHKYHSAERLDEARRADEESRRARSVVYIIRFPGGRNEERGSSTGRRAKLADRGLRPPGVAIARRASNTAGRAAACRGR